MFNRPATTRLHIRSIKDVSSAYDHELADLFSEMREATGLELEETATRLGSTPDVIAALEKGDIAALPEWGHVQQVVKNYAGMLSLDPGPLLRRIMVQLPDEHRQRPKTSDARQVSHDNVQANAAAAMHKVPPSRAVQAQEVDSAALPAGIIPATASAAVAKAGPVRTVTERGRAGASFADKTADLSKRLHEAREDISSTHASRYDDFRAIPPGEDAPLAGSTLNNSTLLKPAPARRRGGFFVTLIQLILFIAIIAAAYGAWLYYNDASGFESYMAFFRNGASGAIDWLMGLAKS